MSSEPMLSESAQWLQGSATAGRGLIRAAACTAPQYPATPAARYSGTTHCST